MSTAGTDTTPRTPDPEAVRRIAERYPQRRRRWLLPLLTLTLGALVVYWVWVSAVHANPALRGDVVGFETASPTDTVVRVQVDRRSPTTSGRCLVYVQAVDYERVGEKWVEVAPADQRRTVQQVGVRTFRRGVSASVDRCI